MFDGLPEKYETKPDVFSLEGLIAWLETQDPERRYDFWNCHGGCLLSTYLASVKIWFSTQRYNSAIMRIHGVADDVARRCPWTYGAALERARKMLTSP